MSIVPSDIRPYFEVTDSSRLLQGDILAADKLGLKEEGVPSPDYWMIITRSCDLVVDSDTGLMRKAAKSSLSMVALLGLPFFSKYYGEQSNANLNGVRKRIVILAASILPKLTMIKAGQIVDIIDGKLSRFFYIPPDGTIIKDPLIIDFDITDHLLVENGEDIKKVQSSKTLQLASPYREKMAQRFAEHYSSIGVSDDAIRAKSYKTAVQKLLSGQK